MTRKNILLLLPVIAVGSAAGILLPVAPRLGVTTGVVAGTLLCLLVVFVLRTRTAPGRDDADADDLASTDCSDDGSISGAQEKARTDPPSAGRPSVSPNDADSPPVPSVNATTADDLFAAFDDPGDPSTNAAPATSLFEDLAPKDVPQDDYQPSFRSLLFALSDVDPDLASSGPRPASRGISLTGASKPRAASPGQPPNPSTTPGSRPVASFEKPSDSPAATDVRPLSQVARTSPFGTGAPSDRPGQFSVVGDGQASAEELAGAFADPEPAQSMPAAILARPPARRAVHQAGGRKRDAVVTSRSLAPRATALDPDTHAQLGSDAPAHRTSRNIHGTGTMPGGAVPTIRQDVSSDLIDRARHDLVHGVADPIERECRRVYTEFLTALKRAGQPMQHIDYPRFSKRLRDEQQRLLRERPGAHIAMGVSTDGPRPRITFQVSGSPAAP
ncbi:MAG: hypothetical protein EA398_03645 [Deltaproteobacteria bacterium]|nr:MAG: hypothetical protein EA398_03645 [Deltaproteobacteria bacterium]